jgi:hypothetical protein
MPGGADESIEESIDSMRNSRDPFQVELLR